VKHDLILEGHGVRLEPLAERHLPALLATAAHPDLWRWTFGENPFTAPHDARAFLQAALDAADMQAFAIIETASGELAGSTRFLDIQPAFRKMEIGWTFVIPHFMRTNVNTATKLLLLRYAFEEWNAVRVQFKAEAINTRSREAILRIGATYEGTLRNFRMRPDGELRDTSFYSVIAAEWPAVKQRLLTLLAQSRDTRAAG
jgi:RimJ/RimL family protein N-acetyltransferase